MQFNRWTAILTLLFALVTFGADPPGTEVTCRRFAMPIDYEWTNASIWRPAGPDADVYTITSANPGDLPTTQACRAFYIRKDGWMKSLPRLANGSGPIFDGKYLWFVGCWKNSTAIYAYDTKADQIFYAAADEGVPADPVMQVQIAPLKIGTVFIAASAGNPPKSTWVAMAKLEGMGPPTCDVILKCDEQVNRAAKNVPISAAFEPGFMFVLPGPPGGGNNATPHIYIGREMQQMILVDPDTGECSLTKGRGFYNWIGHGADNGGLIQWHEKLYYGAHSWDPRNNLTQKTPMPADIQGVFGTTIHGDTMYYFDGTSLYSGPPGVKPSKLAVKYISNDDRERSYDGHLVDTNVFGLVADSSFQLLVNGPNSTLTEPSVLNFRSWLDRHVSAHPDAPGYDELVKYYGAEGQQEKLIQAVDGYLKYADHDLYRAEREVTVANYFMGKGDYTNARKYADDAAEIGSAWALQSSCYVAEGLGDWPRAEKLIKGEADGYGNPLEWYEWCCRTGHGDLAAAKAQAATAAAAGESGTQREGLVNATVYHLLCGEDAKATAILIRMYTAKPDAWAALNAALISAAAGDTVGRDSALAAIPGFVDSPNADEIINTPAMHDIAALIAEAFKANKSLDAEKIDSIIPQASLSESFANHKYIAQQAERSNIYYFAGRFLLIRGDKDRGIAGLKRAAACNSFKAARTLAAVQLRSLGIDPPKPGADP